MHGKSHPTLQTWLVAMHWNQSTLQMDSDYMPTVRFAHQQNTWLRTTHFQSDTHTYKNSHPISQLPSFVVPVDINLIQDQSSPFPWKHQSHINPHHRPPPSNQTLFPSNHQIMIQTLRQSTDCQTVNKSPQLLTPISTTVPIHIPLLYNVHDTMGHVSPTFKQPNTFPNLYKSP